MKVNNIILVFLAILLMQCNQKGKYPMQGASPDEIREQLIESSRNNALHEDQLIDRFVSANKLNMIKTGTGLRYQITVADTTGAESILSEQLVRVNYSVSLLSGKKCYSSEKNVGSREFTVDKDDVETGLHEGIKRLKKGEHAIFILPSHLAHGFTGDQQCIPGNSPIVYDIEVLSVR